MPASQVTQPGRAGHTTCMLCSGLWTRERWPLPLHPFHLQQGLESWLQGHESRRLVCPSTAAVLQRADPPPHLGNTIELVMLVSMQVSRAQGHESKRTVLAPLAAWGIGWVSLGSAGVLPLVVKIQKNPQANQLTQLPPRSRTRAKSWPTSTLTLSMNCRGTWRGCSCRSEAVGSPWYSTTARYPRRVSVRI